MTDNPKIEDNPLPLGEILIGSMLERTRYVRKLLKGMKTLESTVESIDTLGKNQEGTSSDTKDRTYTSVALAIADAFAINEIDFEPSGMRERTIATTQYADNLKGKLLKKREKVFGKDGIAIELGLSDTELSKFAETAHSATEYVNHPESWDSVVDGIGGQLTLQERVSQIETKIGSLTPTLSRNLQIQRAGLGLARELHKKGSPELAMSMYVAVETAAEDTDILARVNLGKALALTKIIEAKSDGTIGEFDITHTDLIHPVNVWIGEDEETLHELASTYLLKAIIYSPEINRGVTVDSEDNCLIEHTFDNDGKDRYFMTPELALFTAAQVLSKNQRSEDSVERLIEYAVSSNPEITDVATQLAQHYHQAGKTTEVGKIVEGVVRASQSTNLEEGYQSPIESALLTCSKGDELAQAISEAAGERIRQLRNKRNYIGAKTLADNILKVDPENFLATYYKGTTLLEEGNKSEAAGCFNKCLELKPGHKNTTKYLTRAMEN
jgi:tetratricopeptide (TPR) repeat protein